MFQDSYPSSIDIFFRPFSPLDSFEADILSSEEGLHFDEGNETQHDSSHEKGEKPSAFTTLEVSNFHFLTSIFSRIQKNRELKVMSLTLMRFQTLKMNHASLRILLHTLTNSVNMGIEISISLFTYM